VLFNGDYSDELFMSYQYASRCENEHEFLLENKKLLSSIHYFDSLRSDRCISGWGLETRTPFADRALVDFVIEVDPKLKMHNKRIEKWLLRRAFADEGLIPDEVLWRPKLAFSNGVSDKNRDWKDIIKEHVDHLVSDEEFSRESQKYTTCTPVLKESYYYRKIFEQFYPGTTPIPYFWLPNQRWVGGNVADPSARVLAFNREV
jgi:asparagine synthase (glutamine-hydrolysing)